MKKILFLMAIALMMVGCKSREEKAAELIKQEMFKTLYDFESYEPIETKIDSAFTSIYTDTLALLYANEVSSMFNELDDAETEYESAKSAMEIWSDSYSSLGVYKFNEAKKKVNDYIEKIDDVLKKTENIYESIKKRNNEIGRSFIGWKATHKFRCKTKGGNFDLGNYLYVFGPHISVDRLIFVLSGDRGLLTVCRLAHPEATEVSSESPTCFFTSRVQYKPWIIGTRPPGAPPGDGWKLEATKRHGGNPPATLCRF